MFRIHAQALLILLFIIFVAYEGLDFIAQAVREPSALSWGHLVDGPGPLAYASLILGYAILGIAALWFLVRRFIRRKRTPTNDRPPPVRSRHVVREVIRKPLKEAGFGRAWAWPTPWSVTQVYRPAGQRAVWVENFDGALIFHLTPLGSYELEGEPTGLWGPDELEAARDRVRALLVWRTDQAAPLPSGWTDPKISLRDFV